MSEWTYRDTKATQFSAFVNKNGNPTVGVRLVDGTSVHLSLNGGAKDISLQKLAGYNVARTDFGRRLSENEHIPVTIRECILDDGTIQRELASPAIADKAVLDNLFGE